MGTIRILWVKKMIQNWAGRVGNGVDVGGVGEVGETRLKNSVLLATNKQAEPIVFHACRIQDYKIEIHTNINAFQ